MAISKNIHFEVQGLKGRSWTVIQIEKDEKAALKRATKEWETKKYKAVKVLRERLNPDTGDFSSSEIFKKGVEKKDKERKGGARSKGCWKPGDFANYEGRRTVRQLLGSDLEKWQVTPVELANCPDHYYRLDDTGVLLQNAVQKAAVVQVKGTDKSIQDRMKELYSLIEIRVEQIKELWEGKDVPKVSPSSFDKIVKDLADDDNHSQLMTLGLTKYFMEAKTYFEKLEKLFEMVKSDHPGWVLKISDTFVSEFLHSPTIVKDLLGNIENTGQALAGLASLSRGELEDASGTTDKLNGFLSHAGTTQSKKSIYDRLAKELSSGKPLVGGNTKEELEALASIITAIRGKADDKIPDFQLIEAIDACCNRFLSQQYIGEYLEDTKDNADQVRLLLELDPFVLGETAKRKLSGYIMPMILSPHDEFYFKGMEGNYLVRMQMITDLQTRIIKSQLPEEHMKKLSERLDEYCIHLLTNTKLLQTVAKKAGDPIAAGMQLLKLLAGGYFTVGRAASAARQETRKYMRVPDFIEKSIEAPNQEEMSANLMNLRKLMVKAGLKDPLAG